MLKASFMCICITLFGAGRILAVSSHTVVKGDTLWGLSERNYKDPYLWPSLWEVNKSTVTNPDLIFVGQVLNMPELAELKKITPQVVGETPKRAQKVRSSEGSKKTAEPKADVSTDEFADLNPSAPSVDETAAEPPAETLPQSATAPSPEIEAKSEPFALVEQAPSLIEPSEKNVKQKDAGKLKFPMVKVISKGFKADGVVIGFKEDKLLVSQGDTVYVNMLDKSVGKDEKLGIYRKGTKLRAGGESKEGNIELSRVGVLRITSVPSDMPVTALILYSSDPIEFNDVVMRAEK